MDSPTGLIDDPSPRRLSRPRSLVSSSYLLKRLEQHHKPLSSLTLSTSYEVGGYPTFARSKSRERITYQDARSKLRAYLHAPKKWNADSSDEDEEGQRGLPKLAKGVKNRLSRVGTASSSSQLSSPAASTSHLSSDSNPHLDLTDSARMIEEIKEKAYMDSIAAQNHIPSPIDEDMHVDSIPSPIRRKSLYTPGIATRTPNDILRKPPPLQILQSPADRDYYFNPNMPTSSPLARLAALEIGKSGRSTPNLDYSPLGGLRLGTLRVTNGPPSPKSQEVGSHPPTTTTPDSVDNGRGLEDHVKERGYEEGHVAADDSDSTGQENSHASLSNSPVEDEPTSSSTPGHRQLQVTDSSISEYRSGSPLKNEQVIDDKDSEKTSGRSAHFKWLNRRQSLPSGFFSTSASALALDYTQLLPEPPFQRAQTANDARFESRRDSSTDEIDDASFEDEGLVMSKSYRSALEMWRSSVHDADKRKPYNETTEDAYRKLNANSVCQQGKVSRPVSPFARTKAAVDSRSVCTHPSTIKSNQKADSGYSSSESLALSNIALADEVATAESRSGAPECESKGSFRHSGPPRLSRSLSQKVTTSNVARPTDKQNLSCMPAPADVPPASPTVSSTLIEGSPSNAGCASHTLVISSPRSMSKTRKLGQSKQLSRQLSVNSIVVQGVHQLSQLHIPAVPKDVALKHAERLHEFPTLKHALLSSQHVESDDGLQRENPESVPIRFPSPAHSLERADSICKADLDWPSSRSTKSKKVKTAPKSSPFSSSKAARRSSQNEGATVITDFGTVTECLGGNPYDIASSTASYSWKRASISHPHQISTALPRAKSMIGLTTESAAQLAKLQGRYSTPCFSKPSISSSRSFDSLEKIQGIPVRPHGKSVDVPPVPALPKGYSGREIKHNIFQPFKSSRQELSNSQATIKSMEPKSVVLEAAAIPTIAADDSAKLKSPVTPRALEPRRKRFNDRGGIPGKLARPRSTFEKAPPVPVLPSKNELQHIEAQISRSTPNQPRTVTAPIETQKPAEQEIKAAEKSTAKLLDSVDSWKPHREAWSQRRKSAGDALLLRSRTESLHTSTALDGHADSSDQSDPTPVSQPSSNISIHAAMPTAKQRRPPLRQISQSQSSPPIETDSTTSSPSIRQVTKSSTFTSVAFGTPAGRFAGGFHYGYEPGLGLGGSAGTRIANSGASRKSIHDSRGYGLDLSDVPVFVAPS